VTIFRRFDMLELNLSRRRSGEDGLALPVWMQMIQVVATLVIAMFAAAIAYGQWRAAHEKLILDLFDRRLAVYSEIREIVADIVRSDASGAMVYIAFYRAIDKAEFLFGNDVASYLARLGGAINRHASSCSMLENTGLSHADRQAQVAGRERAYSELLELDRVFTKVFAGYLRMDQSKHGVLNLMGPRWPWC
jgi:hypothetical protein